MVKIYSIYYGQAKKLAREKYVIQQLMSKLKQFSEQKMSLKEKFIEENKDKKKVRTSK